MREAIKDLILKVENWRLEHVNFHGQRPQAGVPLVSAKAGAPLATAKDLGL